MTIVQRDVPLLIVDGGVLRRVTVADLLEGPPGPGNGPLPITSVEVFGHSWGQGAGSTDPKYTFASRLGKLFGDVTVNNLSQGGGQVANVAAGGGVGRLLQSGLFATDLTTGPYMTAGGLKVCIIGLNDGEYSAIADGDELVENALQLAYSRLLAARVVDALTAGPALNVAYSYGGAWAAQPDVTVCSGPGYAYALGAGPYAELPLDAHYDGEGITVLCPIPGGYASYTAAVTVDGEPHGSLNTAPYIAAVTAAGNDGASMGIRIPPGTLAPGAHTLRTTIAGVAGGSLACFGGVIIEGRAPLVVPLIPNRPGDAATTTGIQWSNARNVAAMADFPTAIAVDLNPAMAPNYGGPDELLDEKYWYDVAHPNNRGYARITAAIVDALRVQLTPDQVGEMS